MSLVSCWAVLLVAARWPIDPDETVRIEFSVGAISPAEKGCKIKPSSRLAESV
jgi:hypothetical protein